MYMCKPGNYYPLHCYCLLLFIIVYYCLLLFIIVVVVVVVVLAIERAMAYLDTNELPWDMDLFENGQNHDASLVRVHV